MIAWMKAAFAAAVAVMPAGVVIAADPPLPALPASDTDAAAICGLAGALVSRDALGHPTAEALGATTYYVAQIAAAAPAGERSFIDSLQAAITVGHPRLAEIGANALATASACRRRFPQEAGMRAVTLPSDTLERATLCLATSTIVRGVYEGAWRTGITDETYDQLGALARADTPAPGNEVIRLMAVQRWFEKMVDEAELTRRGIDEATFARHFEETLAEALPQGNPVAIINACEKAATDDECGAGSDKAVNECRAKFKYGG